MHYVHDTREYSGCLSALSYVLHSKQPSLCAIHTVWAWQWALRLKTKLDVWHKTLLKKLFCFSRAAGGFLCWDDENIFYLPQQLVDALKQDKGAPDCSRGAVQAAVSLPGSTTVMRTSMHEHSQQTFPGWKTNKLKTYEEPTWLLRVGEWNMAWRAKLRINRHNGDEETGERMGRPSEQRSHLWSLDRLWGAYLLLLQ